MTIIYQIYTDIYHYRNEQLTKSILPFRRRLAVVYWVNLEYIWLLSCTLSTYSLQKGKSCDDSRHVKLTLQLRVCRSSLLLGDDTFVIF